MSDFDDALGREVAERGLVTPELLERAQAECARTGKGLEQVFREMGAFSDDTLRDLERALAPIRSDRALRLEGRTLGQYRLDKRIGKGGMGAVYRAYDTERERTFAVKCMLETERPSDVQRFLREASTASLLKHPNIVGVYTIEEADGILYIVMELLSGRPLSQRLREEPRIQRGEAVRVVRDVARALAYAHDLGIMHRDVKPRNIMVCDDGHARLMDFGLAREMTHGATVTTKGHVMGTPQYMSPERAQASRRTVDHRSDVWSCGVILYEIATGRMPFAAKTPVDVLDRILKEDPEPPCRVDPSLPADLETIILKCLEKDPRHRYATARELAEDLDRYLEGKPIVAQRRHVRSRAWIAAVLTLAAAAVAAGVILLLRR